MKRQFGAEINRGPGRQPATTAVWFAYHVQYACISVSLKTYAANRNTDMARCIKYTYFTLLNHVSGF